jgi:trehalose 6-phosphate phosphatase
MTLVKQLISILAKQPIAWFLDIDGTLVDFCDDANQVRLDKQLIANLQTIFTATEGALALVSGRSIEQIDQLTAPFQFPAAGGHGAHYRFAHKIQQTVNIQPARVDSLYQQLKTRLSDKAGVNVEIKPQGMAVHFRLAPELQAEINALLIALIVAYPEFTLQPGKAVLEIKPKGINKGLAIEHFLTREAFRHRCPLFIGDDLTDEAGFFTVNRVNGISIKVGAGETKAKYHLENVNAVQELIHKMSHYYFNSKKNSGEATCKG